jgi:protease-4
LVFFIVTVGMGMLALCLPLAFLAIGQETASEFAGGFAGGGSGNPDMREVFVPGAAGAHCPQKIAVIEIHGIILAEGGRGFAESRRLVEELEQAAMDDDVVAVILDMDTPGGGVTASDEIYRAVCYCAEYKPVITCMRSMGASGGYYVAAGSDWIIANRHTLTGSIGVIISAFNYAELLERWGLKMETIKSGSMKDMLSGSRPTNQAEREYVQALVQETFREFAAIVAEGRPAFENVDAVLAADFADGRIMRGPAALEVGLIDQLGYFDDAVDKAIEMADCGPAKLIRYHRRPSLSDILFSATAERDLTQNVLPANLRALKAGGLYAIWPQTLGGVTE